MQLQKPENQNLDYDTIRKKIIICKILVSLFSLVCVILVIFILSKSSVFFGYLFTLSTQSNVKSYLKAHYQNYIATLYFSIFGFVICCTNAVIFFFKFSQKDKMVWFHGGYFIGFFICGIVALAQPSYNNYMKEMNNAGLSAVACNALPIPYQCSIMAPYLTYKQDFTSFYVSFIIFFLLYTIVYHYSVIKLLPYQQELSIKQKQQKKQIQLQNASTIIAANKNDNYVSDMFINEYIYYQ